MMRRVYFLPESTRCWVCGGQCKPGNIACAACECACKSQADRAFVNAGGTRAHFEAWWPGVWRAACAEYAVTAKERVSFARYGINRTDHAREVEAPDQRCASAMPAALQLPEKGTRLRQAELCAGEHLVQFYDADRVLLDMLEDFVGGGLRSGDATVVIATTEHIRLLEERLDSVEADFHKARAAHRYIAIEAEQALACFMKDDWPDDVRFFKFVKALLGRSKPVGRKVRAFGEMVAIMWARGEQSATIHLEHLWHHLCVTEHLCLLCSYPKRAFNWEASASIREICAAHSRVLA